MTLDQKPLAQPHDASTVEGTSKAAHGAGDKNLTLDVTPAGLGTDGV